MIVKHILSQKVQKPVDAGKHLHLRVSIVAGYDKNQLYEYSRPNPEAWAGT